MRIKCKQCKKEKNDYLILPSGICDDCDIANETNKKKEEEKKNSAKGLKTSSFDGSMSQSGFGVKR